MSTTPTVQPFEGDNALWCYIGVHTYDTERCRYCQRHNPNNTTLPTVNN